MQCLLFVVLSCYVISFSFFFLHIHGKPVKACSEALQIGQRDRAQTPLATGADGWVDGGRGRGRVLLHRHRCICLDDLLCQESWTQQQALMLFLLILMPFLLCLRDVTTTIIIVYNEDQKWCVFAAITTSTAQLDKVVHLGIDLFCAATIVAFHDVD